MKFGVPGNPENLHLTSSLASCIVDVPLEQTPPMACPVGGSVTQQQCLYLLWKWRDSNRNKLSVGSVTGQQEETTKRNHSDDQDTNFVLFSSIA